MHSKYFILSIFAPSKFRDMYLLETVSRKEIKKIHILKAGPVYVFDTYIVSEFNEGALIDYSCFIELYSLLDIYSNNNDTYGYISHRKNTYAVKAADFLKVQSVIDKKYPVAVVTYNEDASKMFEFEKQLYKCDASLFNSLDKAMTWLSQSFTKAC